MAIVLACTYDADVSGRLSSILEATGIWPAIASHHDDMLPKDLLERLTDVHEIDFADSKTIKQYSPGKSWEIHAADLILANAKRKRWGWSSPKNINFLDFWRDFDPQCRFVLAYSSPTDWRARNMEKNLDVSKELEVWTAFHSEMLKFYYNNKDCSVLINTDFIYREPREVSKTISKKFNFTSSRKLASLETEFPPYAPITYLIADALSSKVDDSANLFQELEAVADFPGNSDESQNATYAREEYSKLKSDIKAINEEMMIKKTQNLDVISSDEVDLLKLQLNQVQEELQYYFCEYQKTLATKLPVKSKSTEMVSVDESDILTIDLRNFIDGDNWHNPEEDGRWAGPGKKTTLNISGLKQGRYNISINILTAMSSGIVQEMGLSFAGREVPIKRNFLSHLKGPLAPLRRVKARMENGGLRFPVLISGVVNYTGTGNEPAQLTLTVPDTISPSSTGESDNRLLSVFIREVKFQPLREGA